MEQRYRRHSTLHPGGNPNVTRIRFSPHWHGRKLVRKKKTENRTKIEGDYAVLVDPIFASLAQRERLVKKTKEENGERNKGKGDNIIF